MMYDLIKTYSATVTGTTIKVYLNIVRNRMDVEIISEYIAEEPRPKKLYSNVGCSTSLNPPSNVIISMGIDGAKAYKGDIVSIDKMEKQVRSIPDTMAI